jgi:hypothetical protein
VAHSAFSAAVAVAELAMTLSAAVAEPSRLASLLSKVVTPESALVRAQSKVRQTMGRAAMEPAY